MAIIPIILLAMLVAYLVGPEGGMTAGAIVLVLGVVFWWVISEARKKGNNSDNS